MKQKLLALLIAGSCAAPSLAYAATPYVSACTGLGIAGDSTVNVSDKNTFKSGMPWGGAIGLKGDEYRVEAALGYQLNHIDSSTYAMPSGGRVGIFSYMANAYYDYALDKCVAPYLMGGLGGASMSLKEPGSADVSKSVFAWQLGLGVGVKATDNVVVDLGYRYFKPGAYTVTDAAYGGSVKHTASSSNILLGLRYNF